MNNTAGGVISFAVGAATIMLVIIVVFYPAMGDLAMKLCAQIGSVLLS